MLSLKEIKYYGDLSLERVVFQVLQDCDLGYYMIAVTRVLQDGEISATLRNVKWLPDKKLSSGDMVVIYSGVGINSEDVDDNGVKTHKVYWGRSEALNEANKECVVCFQLKNWKTAEKVIGK